MDTPVPLTEKLALNIREVSALTGVCRTNLFLAIAAGELKARKRGASTLILPADLHAWLNALPYLASAPEAKAPPTAPAAEMDAPAPAPRPLRRRPMLVK